MKPDNKKIRLLTAILMLSASCAAISYGRVFQLFGSATAGNASQTLTALGGVTAYDTEININGGNGRLTVFHFKQDIRLVVELLGSAFGKNNFNYSGGTLCLASLKSENSVLQFVISSLNDNTIVFKLEQTSAEHAASRAKPASHLMNSIPAFPGSTPLFFAEDKKNGMSMATAATTSSPDEIRRFFNSRLTASGWENIIPRPAGPIAFSPTAIYQKKSEISCVFVIPSNNAGENQIVMLHKQQAIE